MRSMYDSWYRYEDGYAHKVFYDSVCQDYDPELAAINKQRWETSLLGMERTICGLILSFSNKIVFEPRRKVCSNCVRMLIMMELSS